MKRKFSPVFMAALTGMSVLTHMGVTGAQEEIQPAEKVKITCFQNGVKIIEEDNLSDYRMTNHMLYAQYHDGRWITITKDHATCLIETSQVEGP